MQHPTGSFYARGSSESTELSLCAAERSTQRQQADESLLEFSGPVSDYLCPLPQNVAESRKAFLPKIQELDEALQKTPKDEKLLAEKKEIDDNLNMASQSLVAMQVGCDTLLRAYHGPGVRACCGLV